MIRTSSHTTGRSRSGFTLVELLVSAAVSIIIMTILATVFQLGIDTMRQMRSAGDMADQLRAVNGVIQRDLQGNTFVSEDDKINNGLKLSNQRFDLNDLTQSPPFIINPLPIGGFMYISSSASTIEGTDADGFTSSIATNHVLQFTSVLANNSEQSVFTAVSPPVTNVVGGTTYPPQTYTSPAAEIAYFLASTPGQPATFTTGLNGSTPMQLFNLYRRQRLVAMNTDSAVAFNTTGTSDPSPGDAISWSPGNTFINTMQTMGLSAASSRLNSLTPFPQTSSRFGEDVLLSNVLSFEVKVNWTAIASGVATPRSFGSESGTTSTDYPFDNLTSLGGTIDTTLTKTVTNAVNVPATQVRVLAIQIRIRIYDPKLNNARQMTIIQNM